MSTLRPSGPLVIIIFRFVISLQAGPSIEPRSDTAFVFHVRFNESCVVRNTLQYGNWGTEERGDGFPFQRGVPMEVIILVKPHHYKVCIIIFFMGGPRRGDRGSTPFEET